MEDFLKKGIENAQKKFLKATFEIIEDIESNKTFIVESTSPAIDKIQIFVKKKRKYFSFTSSSLNLFKEIANYQNEGYGFLKPFTLKNSETYWEAPKGVAKLHVSLREEVVCDGEIWNFENSFIVNEKKFFRLIVPKEYTSNNYYASFIQSENYAVGESLRFGGLIDITCNNNIFHIFEYNINKKYFLIIDSISPLLFKEFEKSVESIVYSLGLITGYIPREEMYIFQSDIKDFNEISGFQYSKTEKTISSGMEIVSPELLLEIINGKYKKGQITKEVRDKVLALGYIPKTVLSNMSTKAIKDNRFLRSLKIISEGNEFPLEFRASAYSVALETIKNIIIEENEDKINPFKEKKFARDTIKKLKEIITPIEITHFNNKEAVINKLESINQVTNKDSFKISFALYNIKLTESDDKALENRNDFLHGRIPFESEDEAIQNRELKFITYKLHFLVTALLMKYSGFNGFLKNNPKYYSVFGENNKEIDEPLFRKI